MCLVAYEIWSNGKSFPLIVKYGWLKCKIDFTDPQTPKTHLSNREPCTDKYRLSSDLDNRPQSMLQCRHHLDRSLASCSCRHHSRLISFSTHPRLISSPPLNIDLSFPINLSFPQSLNLSLFDLLFFCCYCGGVGGVLVVFVLCGSGFCVDSSGFSVGVGM